MRHIGYQPLTKTVVVDTAAVSVDFALRARAVPLEELVTTATGRQRRRDLGNAITTIHADSVLRNAPIRSLTDLLQNRVPGLTTQHTSGAPGDPARLRLRGISSMMRNNDPVVVVDGMRVYAAQSEMRSSNNLTNLVALAGPSTGETVKAPAPSPLDQIDPNIIEKIEVFKGPSAATLYGADAANGVIVITTKRGKPGPTRWNVSIAHGRTVQPGRYAEGYYRWGHSLFDNTLRFCTLLDVLCVQDSLVRFQALNEPSLTLFGRGQRTDLSLTASGGTQALTYSVTGTYGNETGLLKLPDFEVDRFRSLFNKEAPEWMRRPHLFKTWSIASSVTARLGRAADVALTTVLSRSDQQRSFLERQIASMMGTYVDTVNGIYYLPGQYTQDPTSAILQNYYLRTTASSLNVTTGLNASWNPTSWFQAAGRAGLNVIPRDDETFLPSGLFTPTDSGALARGTGRSLVSTFNVTGAVRKALPHGFVLETRVGADLTSATTNDLMSSASGLVPGTSSMAGATHLDSTGTVAAGKRADLVLLNGNPLEDVRHTAGPAGVMVGGRWIPRAEIDARLEALGLEEKRDQAWRPRVGMPAERFPR